MILSVFAIERLKLPNGNSNAMVAVLLVRFDKTVIITSNADLTTGRMDTAETTYSFLSSSAEMPRGSMAARVAAQLRNAIIELRLPPGTMLDKAQICARLGVSRSPVAEAFARLESEGLLDILPQRGTVVSFLSLGAIKEYIFIRKALEGEAVRTLASRRPASSSGWKPMFRPSAKAPATRTGRPSIVSIWNFTMSCWVRWTTGA